jgi:lysophospholipid acyltransferase (LPLAT)-like uncharacterized protein
MLEPRKTFRTHGAGHIQRATGMLIRIVMTIISATLCYHVEDSAGLLKDMLQGRVIFAFWHSHIILMPCLFRKYWRPRGRNRVAVLVSNTEYGNKTGAIMVAFGLRRVRGSTGERGAEAFRELAHLISNGYDVGIAPDGPHGPPHEVQLGVVKLAQLTGAAVVPLAYSFSRKISANTWDSYAVPLPFTSCYVRIGAPVFVSQDADREVIEQKRVELEQTLRNLSSE